MSQREDGEVYVEFNGLNDPFDGVWLFYLRSTGHITFEPGPRSQRLQIIPRHLGVDVDSLLTHEPRIDPDMDYMCCRGIRTADDLMRLAPPFDGNPRPPQLSNWLFADGHLELQKLRRQAADVSSNFVLA